MGLSARVDTDVLVVGGGVVGLSAALAAARAGRSALLVDARPLLNDHNASNDESKVFRLAYGPDEDMVALAKDALREWRALEAATRRRVLHTTGLFMMDGAFARESAATLERLGEPVERGAHSPALSGEGIVDPQGGWLDPAEALAALEETCLAAGARVRRGVGVASVAEAGDGALASLVDGSEIRARRVVVAAGFDAPALVPSLARRIVVTRQPELFFRAPRGLASFPVFAALEEGYYGFPERGGAVKVADHRKGRVVRDALAPREPPTQDEVDEMREWLAGRVPLVADAPLVSWRVCYYDNAQDDRFIVEREGPFVVAAGMSGHAFKFAPALGARVAALL